MAKPHWRARQAGRVPPRYGTLRCPHCTHQLTFTVSSSGTLIDRCPTCAYTQPIDRYHAPTARDCDTPTG